MTDSDTEPAVETHEFKAETQQLLDLMIHSLYTHKEIFLRELISNASDALDKLRFESLTEPSLKAEAELAISLHVDPEARTLSISDNGIGMTRDEVAEQIGTIARSGTAEFLKSRAAKEGGDASPDLIGQFGVGFYSSFMAADRVQVATRKAGSEGGGTLWESSADGRYTLTDAERPEVGTTVTLYLKPVDGEGGLPDFTDEWVLRDTVRRYSDFVGYPIRLSIDGKEEQSDEPLNSMKAIWTRPEGEVEEDDYNEFYRHISHDHQDPLMRIRTKIEGTFEASALLYVPSKAPFDLYHRERSNRGVQLYVRRVFIMDECRDLLPEYLRFVKGVVDAEDITLNVSREVLQQDPQIAAIRKHLVKKVLESLAGVKKDDPDKYLGFWAHFGPVMKEGLLAWEEKKDRILDLLLCASTESASGLTSLSEYVDRMSEDTQEIYYLTGASREVLASSPHLEALRAKGIEVLLFTDPVDEVWLQQMPPEYRGKQFRAAGVGEIDLQTEDEKKDAAESTEESESDFKELLMCLRAAVQDSVSEVRLSNRLLDSPACLVREAGDLSPQMSEMLRQAGQEVPEIKPILEVNAAHALLLKLKEIFEQDGTDPRLSEYASLLHGQAVIAEGGELDDPAAFSRRLTALMLDAL